MKQTNIFAAIAAISLVALGVPTIAQNTPGSSGAPAANQSGAQAPNESGGVSGDRAARLAAALKLTGQQNAKWESIVRAGRQKAKAVFQNGNLTDDRKRAQVRAIRKSALSHLRAILTPIQQKELDKIAARVQAGRS